MNRRLPLWLRHLIYNLRGGFLVRPLSIALVLGFAGATFSAIEEAYPAVSSVIPTALFPSHADPEVAQVILSDIASSIMTVVSIVFAILLMTLTLASMQFSPRIIVSFARDRVTQWTLGIFLGTFLYCIAALPTARALPRPVAPVATVSGAMLLALACVAWLLFFIHHISRTISVTQIVDRIASETEAIIDEMMPHPRTATVVEHPDLLLPGTWTTPVLSNRSGYIRFVDLAELVALAKASRVKIRLVRRIGQFVPAGSPLLMISKPDRLSPAETDELRDAVDIGSSRTLQQDIEFGILQIVDIALKAISPAVNDPSTAINGIDHLSRVLIRFLAREPGPGLLYDPPGVLRVSIGWPDFDQLLHSAFDQIRLYSKTDIAVSLRLLRALGDIAQSTTDETIRRALAQRGERIVAGCAERLTAEDLTPLRSRLAELDRLAG